MWHHGYFTGTPYVSGFYREMAPNWLDFASQIKGQTTLRSREGSSFTYLELGSGMGLHLCLLAAAYPEGKFVGIDLMPDHVLASQRLAQQLDLGNISFLRADLAEITPPTNPIRELGIESGCCDYIVCHGLFSWVDCAVQEAILNLVTRYLRLGGCFYCSYNTLPGWLSRSIFHASLQLELEQAGTSRIQEAISQTIDRLIQLWGSDDQKSDLATALPGVRSELELITRQNCDYLIHEFGNKSWRPLYVHKMHEQCRSKGLAYQGSATLPELFDDLLPEPVRTVVQTGSNQAMKELMRDIGTMQSFRRDIFLYGKTEASRMEVEMNLLIAKVKLIQPPEIPKESVEIKTPFGPVTLNNDVYVQLIQLLSGRPRSIGDLTAETGLPMNALLPAVSLLIHAGTLALHRGDAAHKAMEAAKAANRILLERGQAGLPLSFLVAPSLGSAIQVQQIDSWLLPAVRDGLEGESLIECVRFGVSLAGITVKKGLAEYESDDVLNKDILERAEMVRTRTLPLLKEIGCV